MNIYYFSAFYRNCLKSELVLDFRHYSNCLVSSVLKVRFSDIFIEKVPEPNPNLGFQTQVYLKPELTKVWISDKLKFGHLLHRKCQYPIHSERPRTGRPVWQTGQNCIRLSNFRFSDVRFINLEPNVRISAFIA